MTAETKLIDHTFEPREFWALGTKLILDHSRCGYPVNGQPCNRPKEDHHQPERKDGDK